MQAGSVGWGSVASKVFLHKKTIQITNTSELKTWTKSINNKVLKIIYIIWDKQIVKNKNKLAYIVVDRSQWRRRKVVHVNTGRKWRKKCIKSWGHISKFISTMLSSSHLRGKILCCGLHFIFKIFKLNFDLAKSLKSYDTMHLFACPPLSMLSLQLQTYPKGYGSCGPNAF